MVAIDGDTLELDIDHGLNITSTNVRVRLIGIDTPEKNTLAGQLVRQQVQQWLDNSSFAVIELTTKTEKYGRFLGTCLLVTNEEAQYLVDMLLAKGFAKPYNPGIGGNIGVRPTWTDEELQAIVEKLGSPDLGPVLYDVKERLDNSGACNSGQDSF